LRNASSPLVYFNGTEIRAWPFFHTVLWSLYKLFDWNFSSYHLVSIFTHGLNGYFCFKVLKKLQIENSFLIALIFLVHPLQLFNVAWIIQIKTLVATTFLLLSFMFIIDYFKNQNLMYYFFSILLFGLSVLTKSTSALFSLSFLAAYPILKWNISLKKFSFLIFPYLILSFMAIYNTVWPQQQRFLLWISFSAVIFYYLYPKYKHQIIDKIYLIIPLIFVGDLLYVFHNANIKIVPIIFSIVFIFLLIRFKIFVKKFFYILQPLILYLTFILYFPVERLGFYLTLIHASNIIITFKNFLRYLFFIIFPITNSLFPTNTVALQNSYELIGIFISLAFSIQLYLYLFNKQLNLILLGLFFFTITIIPFCGIFQIPIFAFTNFVPYWLGIPFIGLLPFISQFIRSKISLIIIIIILALLSHTQSYSFLTTENLYADAIKNHPDSDLIKISLVEQYIFTNQCEKARKNMANISDIYLLESLSTNKKLSQCREARDIK
jgi:hypothetical protein